MLVDIVNLTIQIYTFMLLAISSYSLYVFKMFPSLQKTFESKEWPMVSIIIPVKNEEDTVKNCLDSILRIDYPSKEIIVVEGVSKDRTSLIIQEYRDKVTILKEEPKPSSWVGKSWACHQGFLKSTGEILLFTDSDTLHSSDSLKRSVNYFVNNKVDLLSLYPKLVFRCLSERIMMPFIALIIVFFFGGSKVNNDASKTSNANGQYLLTKRSAYLATGGHYSIRREIVEDIKLAEAYKKSGFRIRLLYGFDVFETRMYSDFQELWSGWVKNAYAGLNFSKLNLLAGLSSIYLGFILPFNILSYNIITGNVFSNPIGISNIIEIIIIYSCMSIFYFKIGGSLKYAVFTPVAAAIYFTMILVSFYKVVIGGGVEWKDTIYDLVSMKSQEE